jgi:hypothetical protein
MNNKKLKSINNNNNESSLKRDSFSDRICDDLCEVLLSYLSFEDKIRFECVSKQFQSCVNNKQNCLEIVNYTQTKHKPNNLFKKMAKNKCFNYKAFESILKKCKFINNVIIDIDFKSINNEQLMQLIIEYCTYLKSIAFDFNEISDELIEKFGLKFRQKLEKLTQIRFIRDENINKHKMLRLRPNLTALGDIYSIRLSVFVDK